MKIRVMLMNAVVASVITLSGCSTTDILASGDAAATTNQHLKATNPEQVKIYLSKKDMPKHYTVVGRVAAENYNLVGLSISQATIMTELKKQAASLGANGVIHLTTGMSKTTAEAVLVK